MMLKLESRELEVEEEREGDWRREGTGGHGGV